MIKYGPPGKPGQVSKYPEWKDLVEPVKDYWTNDLGLPIESNSFIQEYNAQWVQQDIYFDQKSLQFITTGV